MEPILSQPRQEITTAANTHIYTEKLFTFKLKGGEDVFTTQRAAGWFVTAALKNKNS